MGHLPGGICYGNLSITNGFVHNFPFFPSIRFSVGFAFLRSSLHIKLQPPRLCRPFTMVPPSKRTKLRLKYFSETHDVTYAPPSMATRRQSWIRFFGWVNIINNEYLQLAIRKGLLWAAALKVKESMVDSSFHSLAGSFCGSSSTTGGYLPLIILFHSRKLQAIPRCWQWY